MELPNRDLTVAIAGMGTIGASVARALDRGIEGLRLVAIAARNTQRVQSMTTDFTTVPDIVSLPQLAQADIVVEATPASIFDQVAEPAIAAGRILVTCSAGALLPRLALIEAARETGARIIVPTGALMGLDAVRALAEGQISEISIETRKPPNGLAGAPYLVANGIEVKDISEALLVFEGNALDAAVAFPSNINVAAALALAGTGAEHTMVRIWADPYILRNIHIVNVLSDAARLTMTIENVPSEENPRTSKLSSLSVIACLRGICSPLKVGS
jgi:aspartate dehydrogenase